MWNLEPERSEHLESERSEHMRFEIVKKTGSWLPCPPKPWRRWMPPVSLMAVIISLLSACTGPQMRSDARINVIPSEVRENLTVSGDIHIRGEVKVFPGAVLTVQPGTRFLFEPHDPDGDGVNDSRLVVEGRLVARGEPDAPIYFTSAAGSPEPGDWLELRVDRSEGNVLEYCVLEHSRYGLHVHFSSGVVANSIFRNNIDGTRFGNSHFILSNNLISNNLGKGINFRDSNLNIYNNQIFNNRQGIFTFEQGGNTTVRSNLFYRNEQSDIQFGDFYVGEPPNVEGNARKDDKALSIAGYQGDWDTGDVKRELLPLTGPMRLNVETEELWEKKIGSFVDASPVIFDKQIAVISWEEGVTFLGLQSGDFSGRVELPDVSDATPLLYNGFLYLPSWDRKLRKIDLTSLQVVEEARWDPSNEDDHRQAAPILREGVIVQGLWNGKLGALDPDTMEWLWDIQLEGAIRAQPAEDGKSLWVGTDGGFLYEVGPDRQVAIRIQLDSPVRTRPAVHGPGELSVVTRDGILFRIRDGKVVWRRKLPGKGTYASPLGGLVADGSGALSWFDPSGALLWRTELGAAIHTLDKARDLVWAGTEDGSLYGIYAVTGRIVIRLAAANAVHSLRASIVSKDQDRILWAGRDGVVRHHLVHAVLVPWELPPP